MGWLIGSILSAVMGIVGIAAYVQQGTKENIVVTLLMCALAIFFFVKYRNSKNGKSEQKRDNKSKKKQKQEENRDLLLRTMHAKHQAGLPLAQNIDCSIIKEEESFKITGSGNNFELKKKKITAIDVKTDVEIQKQYVSSIGGAVAGSLVFGPLGAIVGGRAKEKKSTTTTYYLIFTYRSDGEVCYASFEVDGYNLKKAQSWQKEYNEQRTALNDTVEL